MEKQRFRVLKQRKSTQKENKTNKIGTKANTLYAFATAGLKTKAFLTDAFMLLLPLLFIVFYLAFDGREDFAAHRVLGWMYLLLPLLLIQSLFFYFSGQTPGYRAYNLTLVDATTGKRPSLFIIFFRNICAILSFFSVIGWMLMIFRKDSKTLHDLLSSTVVLIDHDK